MSADTELSGRADRPVSPADQAFEAESLKSSVIHAALDAVVISQGDGRIIEFNPAAERMFGQTADEALGRFMSDLIVVPAGEAPAAVHDGNVLGILGQRMTLEGLRAGGTAFPAEIAIQRMDFGDRRLFAAYIRDLTAQRQAEAAIEAQRQQSLRLEQLSMLSSLLAGIAHELNNPLAIIVAQATLLQDKAPTADVARRADRIHEAAQRAGRIVRSFLAMARDKPQVREPVDLNAVVDEALDLSAYGLRAAGLTVERRSDPTLPAVEADRDAMRQAIVSVLVNVQQTLAADAGRTIAVRTFALSDQVAVEVETSALGSGPQPLTGAGKPPTSPSVADAGLSLARSVVAALGGTIAVLSPAEGGVSVRLSFPRIQLPNEAAPQGKPVGHGLSILVVDDEVDVADALAELIGLFGHRVEVKTTAAAALERIAAQPFDMIFTDLHMPGLNGLDLRAAIAERDPALGARTVLMSGDTRSASGGPQAAPAATKDLMLEKPFTALTVKALLDHGSAR